MEGFSEEAIKDAAGTLATVRMMLETVPMEMMEELQKTVGSQKERYVTLQPMLDPTDFQRHGSNKMRDMDTQREAARVLIALKKVWRQDVPIADRIQEELDEAAPKVAEMVDDVKGDHADV